MTEEQSASVEIPAALLDATEQIAERHGWTVTQAVTVLLKRGIDAQLESDNTLARAYDAFMKAPEDNQKAAGDDLIRSIFGPASVA